MNTRTTLIVNSMTLEVIGGRAVLTITSSDTNRYGDRHQVIATTCDRPAETEDSIFGASDAVANDLVTITDGGATLAIAADYEGQRAEIDALLRGHGIEIDADRVLSMRGRNCDIAKRSDWMLTTMREINEMLR